MQILKETTVWNTDYSVPNHTYLLDNKNRLIAYADAKTGKIHISKSQSMVLDKRYRTFKAVNHPGLSKLVKVEKTEGVRLFKVQSGQKNLQCRSVKFSLHLHLYRVQFSDQRLRCF